MRKYRTKRWPFLLCLFSGLACSLSFPKKEKLNDLDGKTSMCRSAKNVGSQNRGVADYEKGAARFNEAYPVGPQLLLILQ